MVLKAISTTREYVTEIPDIYFNYFLIKNQ